MTIAASRRTPLAMVADIGGTNARFALVDLRQPEPQLSNQQVLQSSAFASLEHAAKHYLQDVGVRPARVAIAVASPVGCD